MWCVSNVGFAAQPSGATSGFGTGSMLLLIGRAGSCRRLIRSPHQVTPSAVQRWQSGWALVAGRPPERYGHRRPVEVAPEDRPKVDAGRPSIGAKRSIRVIVTKLAGGEASRAAHSDHRAPVTFPR
jgi:hypothetical protein